jgi:Predicted integral membrane protein
LGKNRLEAFSDGVLAIIITIMVLELKAPHSADLSELYPLISIFVSYILSFLYLGIYWNNHHHMLHTVKTISGGILWANLHLLFWLSLVPFATAWMGSSNFAPVPTSMYGVIMLMASIAYWILQNTIIKKQGKDSVLAKAIGKDFKGKISPVVYGVAILCANYNQWLAGILYFLVAMVWLIPDKRIERSLT